MSHAGSSQWTKLRGYLETVSQGSSIEARLAVNGAPGVSGDLVTSKNCASKVSQRDKALGVPRDEWHRVFIFNRAPSQ